DVTARARRSARGHGTNGVGRMRPLDRRSDRRRVLPGDDQPVRPSARLALGRRHQSLHRAGGAVRVLSPNHGGSSRGQFARELRTHNDRRAHDAHGPLQLALPVLPSSGVSFVDAENILGEPPGTFVPGGCHRSGEKVRVVHRNPFCAKLDHRLPAMMMWSNTGMSRIRPAATSCSVTERSATLAVGSPLGWLWATMIADAPIAIATRNVSRGWTSEESTKPVVTFVTPIARC